MIRDDTGAVLSGTSHTNELKVWSSALITGFQRPFGLWQGVSGDGVP